MNNNFYFSYVGGKFQDTKRFFEFIKIDENIKTIVEPFCGGCGFSRYLYFKENYKKYKYHFNDVDTTLMRFLRDIKKHGSAKYIEYYNNNFKDASDDIDELISKEKDHTITLNEYYTLHKVKRGLTTMKDLRTHKNTIKCHKVDELFKHAKISHHDYSKIFDKYLDDSTAFLFLDPPYLDSFNKGYTTYQDSTDETNTIIDNTIVYIDILNFLKLAKCKVMLIINDNAINRHIYNNYILGTYDKIYYTHGKNSTHLIVGN